MSIIKEMQAERLKIKIYETRQEMGEDSAKEMSETLKSVLKEKKEVNIIFAAAPSQNEFLGTLIGIEGIDWSRVNAFHMDEYIGLDKSAPQGFGNFLKDRIFDRVDFKSVNLLHGDTKMPEEECARYSDLLKKNPADIVCMGIGENGHIAFNDPHAALFKDPKLVKVVELDKKCRQQQVNDGCFNSFSDVPTHALTLTIPALTAAKYVFCIVPGKTKADAVTRTVNGTIDQSCPASILRTHGRAIMYVDRDSGAGII